ncbi:hypothetical protein ACFS4T_14090 [Pseudomonas lini]
MSLRKTFFVQKPGPVYSVRLRDRHKKTSQFHDTPSDELFDFLLRRLETFINNKIDSPTLVKLMTSSNEYETGTVGYEASRQVWSRILNAELTLEAIIIGGMGLIHRPDQNISNIHSKVSKLAYLIQSKNNFERP